MVRLLIRTGIMLVANAVGLGVAAKLLDGMQLNWSAFIEAVVIYTVVFALLTPFFANQFRKHQSSAIGGVSLIASLASLIVTDLISDGLSITGVGTWVAAAVIVWAASLLAAFILPYLGLKKYLEKRDS